MQESHVMGVSHLHCSIFPESRSTKFGKLYVRKMFRWFLEFQPDLSLIAIQNQRIIGYAIGAVGGYGRKLFRFALLEIIMGLIFHPRLWFQKGTFLLWRSYLKGLYPKREKKDHKNQITKQPITMSAALAGIGVDNDQQGQGVGKALLSAFEGAARKSGVKILTLSVHNDNLAARRLYDRSGWVIDSENQAANSVHYVKILY